MDSVAPRSRSGCSLGPLGEPMKDAQRSIRPTRVRWHLVFVLSIAVAAFGCSRSHEREFRAIKKRADPHRIQSWATEILKQYPDTASVTLSNTPSFLQDVGIGRYGPFVNVSAAGPNSNRCVYLLFAYSPGWGGPGHFIDVGDQTFREATNEECIEWIPGVYYRYTFSP
jgi:hypothetical protein